jgi:hypothetical protein
MEPPWSHYGATLEPPWSHYGATMEPLWSHYGATMEPLWSHYGATMEPLWNNLGKGRPLFRRPAPTLTSLHPRHRRKPRSTSRIPRKSKPGRLLYLANPLSPAVDFATNTVIHNFLLPVGAVMVLGTILFGLLERGKPRRGRRRLKGPSQKQIDFWDGPMSLFRHRARDLVQARYRMGLLSHVFLILCDTITNVFKIRFGGKFVKCA